MSNRTSKCPQIAKNTQIGCERPVMCLGVNIGFSKVRVVTNLDYFIMK